MKPQKNQTSSNEHGILKEERQEQVTKILKPRASFFMTAMNILASEE